MAGASRLVDYSSVWQPNPILYLLRYTRLLLDKCQSRRAILAINEIGAIILTNIIANRGALANIR